MKALNLFDTYEIKISIVFTIGAKHLEMPFNNKIEKSLNLKEYKHPSRFEFCHD